jgi:RecG-like helicase
VIDEQHRFGVEQRLNCGRKMIPSTRFGNDRHAYSANLAMSLYGDLDISVLMNCLRTKTQPCIVLATD